MEVIFKCDMLEEREEVHAMFRSMDLLLAIRDIREWISRADDCGGVKTLDDFAEVVYEILRDRDLLGIIDGG